MSHSWDIQVTRQAEKDIAKLSVPLKKKLVTILKEVIAKNPHAGKKLVGDLRGSYSYRLNYQDRIVYSLDEAKKIIYVERARTHYGD